MTYVQLAPMSDHADGAQAQITRAWPNGAHRVSIRFDVWGTGGSADPWTSVTHPFNDSFLSLEGRVLVQYADGRIEEQSRSTWLGKIDGNWGRTTPTQPTMTIEFQPGAELPVQARPGYRVSSGPIAFGVSVEIA